MQQRPSETRSGDPQADKSTPLLRPIIKALLTEEGTSRDDDNNDRIVLLVDRINAISRVRDGERKNTFRLWLSDGQMSIQCLFRRDALDLLVARRVIEGSHVAIDKYRVVQQPKLSGDGKVWVLVVFSLRVVGDDGRAKHKADGEEQLTSAQNSPKRAVEVNKGRGNGKQSKSFSFEDTFVAAPREEDEESVDLIRSPKPEATMPSLQTTPTAKRKADDISGSQPLSPLDANVPANKAQASKRQRLWQQRVDPQEALRAQSEEFFNVLKALQASPTKNRTGTSLSSPTKGSPPASQASPAKTVPLSAKSSPEKRDDPKVGKEKGVKARSSNSNSKISATPSPLTSPQKPSVAASPPKPSRPPPAAASARALKHIQRPVKIVPLSSITGGRATRGRVCDVLVVFSHINERILRRSGFPDGREVLVMDDSTRRQVHLTVFVDAAGFMPEIGSVALLRNITTHEYGGGSLKAYHSRCTGVSWYLPESGTGWPHAERAAELRRHWLAVEEARQLPPNAWWTDRGAGRVKSQGQK